MTPSLTFNKWVREARTQPAPHPTPPALALGGAFRPEDPYPPSLTGHPASPTAIPPVFVPTAQLQFPLPPPIPPGQSPSSTCGAGGITFLEPVSSHVLLHATYPREAAGRLPGGAPPSLSAAHGPLGVHTLCAPGPRAPFPATTEARRQLTHGHRHGSLGQMRPR